MAKLMCIGRVTADLELRESVRKEPYIRFSLAENLGYGETARTQYWGLCASCGFNTFRLLLHDLAAVSSQEQYALASMRLQGY